MSKGEIEILYNSEGEFISINSFLSTSLNRKQARQFLHSTIPSENVVLVLFEIVADPQLDNIKAFSNVKLLSYVPAEEEVLFMVGSIFQLDKVQCDNDGIWNIKMVLCSDNSNQLKTLYEQMKNKLGTGETDLLRFGHVLRGMGKLDDAEKYVRRFLVQLPDHDPNISHGYHALGMVSDLKGEFEASLK
jgi:hypothetical protein